VCGFVGLLFSVQHTNTMDSPSAITSPTRVKSVAPGGAADQAGLKEGERIYAIDGQDITKCDSDHVAALLRGAPGTHVMLRVGPPPSSHTFGPPPSTGGGGGGLPPECFVIKKLSPGSVHVQVRHCCICILCLSMCVCQHT
jgi:hypothetical protein